MSGLVAGIDLGGTASRFVLHGIGELIASKTVATATFADAASVDERLDRFAETIRSLIPPGRRLAAVGIGASGPVDITAGVVRNPDTLLAFSGFDLVRGTERRLGVPVLIDNDAVTAAIGELRLGAGLGARRMLMVTLGTGVGAALLIDGTPFRSADGSHPEAGHIPVGEGSDQCYCGAVGCWETVASRAALQRGLRPLIPAEVADRDLIEAAGARGHEARCGDVFQRYGEAVGRGLGVLHTVYMPEVTVIGGSAAGSFPLFERGLHDALARASGFFVRTEVRAAQLGDLAGALGAASLAADRLATTR